MEDILFHYGGFLFLMEVILLRKMDLFSMLSHYPQMSSLISLLFLMEDILFHYGGFLFLMEVILLRKMDLFLLCSYCSPIVFLMRLFLLFREGHDIKCRSRTYGR